MDSKINDYLKTRRGLVAMLTLCDKRKAVAEAVAEAPGMGLWCGGKLTTLGENPEAFDTLLDMMPTVDDVCNEPEPYAIVEVPCMGGFTYVGLKTREEYEKFRIDHPECYYPKIYS